MSFPIDLTGHKYERLTVIGPASRSPSGRTRWHCRCDCGGTAIAIGNNLRRGKHKSCGCIQEEPSPLRTTFHMRNRPEYWTWKSIKSRCYYPKNQDYHLYGGRGIAVCEAWRRDFFAFYSDMGPRPGPDYSIDRYPDQNGNYEPGNCRWATAEQQANNLRVNRLVTHEGRTQTLAEWAKEAAVSYDRFRMRLNEGWPFELALRSPPMPSGSRYNGPGRLRRYLRPSKREAGTAAWKDRD